MGLQKPPVANKTVVRSPKIETPVDAEQEKDVDVEQFSDAGEDVVGETSRTSPSPSSLSDIETSSKNDDLDEEEDDVDDAEPAKKSSKNSTSSQRASLVKARCNCDQLLQIDCHLETKELWDKFHELGTEMIITKTGR